MLFRSLLDTKGAVLVALNRFDEAAEALRDATEVGGDPRSILHWYDALVKGKKLSEAEEVRQRIDFKALRDFYLSPQDRKILEKARPRDTK